MGSWCIVRFWVYFREVECWMGLMDIRGWVYVVTNKAMPDMVKIGFSTKDPELRARQFGDGGTASPYPYTVEYDVLVDNPRIVEQRTHADLADKRISGNREWFSCSVSFAVSSIKKNIIGTTYSERSGDNVEVMVDCNYYGCTKQGVKKYKGAVYCIDHHKVVRRSDPGRVRAIRRLREEIKNYGK